MKSIIHKEPNWIHEVVACLSDHNFEREKEIIENHGKYGMTKDEMTDFFSKYRQYKKLVTNEIMPIYSNFPSLEKYFQMVEFYPHSKSSLALSIVMNFGDKMSTNMDNDTLDRLMNELLANTIKDLISDNQENEVKVQNLEDILYFLAKANVDDNLQMQIIHLYHNRYEIINKFTEMLSLCVPIFKKHYYIIEDEYKKSLEVFKQIEDLGQFLESLVGMKINSSFDYEITLGIFFFNQLSLNSKDDKLFYSFGMYFLKLVNLKEENKFNDTQIITDLKALAEPTRLKIIGLISKKSMYIQELAEVLELTPATISHHINILLNSELVSITVDAEKNRKIYYEANTEKIEKLGDSIKGLVKLENKGGNVYGGEN